MQNRSERVVRLEKLYKEVENFFKYFDKNLNWTVGKARPQRGRKRQGPYSRLRDSFLEVTNDSRE